MSGVKVELLIPGVRNSQWYLLYMNRMNYWKVWDSNVQIYEYDGFIHSKMIVIDDDLQLVGTFNMDLRSLISNFESMLIVRSEKLNKELNFYYEMMKRNCIFVDENNLKRQQTRLANFMSHLIKFIQPLL